MTMQTKRQKQIRAFLTGKFGKARGSALFDRQEKALQTLIQSERNRSKSQRKTLVQTILPCIALYQTLLENDFSEEQAFACMKSYLLDIVAAQKHAFTAGLEWIPGFYAIYSRIFLNITATSDLWECTQTRSRDSFSVTITKCLWHTACSEAGCPALCRLFCDSDPITYGGLKKLGFSRTTTLGHGGACCDFHFFRK